MKADLTRDTFDSSKSFLRVLMQQGRVQLDADWNEQISILVNYLQRMARDLIGPHGGDGMVLTLQKADGTTTTNKGEIEKVGVGKGNYYVQGYQCSNPMDATFPKAMFPGSLSWANSSRHLFYLDAWERHITHVEDDDIREKALNGPDTTTRSQLVWQLRTAPTTKLANDLKDYDVFLKEVGIGSDHPTQSLQGTGTGELVAFARAKSATDSNPCVVSPESRYRGAENQLYRVEIHDSGFDQVEVGQSNRPVATWKWSRDNGSVVFPIQRIATDSASQLTTVTLAHLGRDGRFGLSVNDCVEILDDDYVLGGAAGKLLAVKEVRENELKVFLSGINAGSVVGTQPEKHPLLRRWDQTIKNGSGTVIPVREGVDEAVELEDGITVYFQSPTNRGTAPGEPKYYRTGDYWLIPARVATGDVEWDRDATGNPLPLPPRGVQHFYAPLAHASVDSAGVVDFQSLRRPVRP